MVALVEEMDIQLANCGRETVRVAPLPCATVRKMEAQPVHQGHRRARKEGSEDTILTQRRQAKRFAVPGYALG